MVFQWWSIVFIFPDPYDSKHPNEISLNVFLKRSQIKKKLREFMLILEIYILIILFYHILMRFVEE